MTESTTYLFDPDNPITCPECGSRCEHPDASAGVAACLGCMCVFQYELEDDDE